MLDESDIRNDDAFISFSASRKCPQFLLVADASCSDVFNTTKPSFYAGTKLTVNGAVIGTLFISDKISRKFDESSQMILSDFGSALSSHIALTHKKYSTTNNMVDNALKQVRDSINHAQQAITQLDLQLPEIINILQSSDEVESLKATLTLLKSSIYEMKQIPSKNYNIHHHSNMKISICDIVHVIRNALFHYDQHNYQHHHHPKRSHIKWNIHVPDGLYLTYPQLVMDTLLLIQHHTYACNNISIIDIDYYSDCLGKQYALILTIQHVIDLMNRDSCCHCLCSSTLITTDRYDETLQLQRRIESIGGAVVHSPCLHPGEYCPNCTELNISYTNSNTELLQSNDTHKNISAISELLITKSSYIIPSKFLHRNDFNHNFNSTPIPSLSIEILLVSDSMVIEKIIQKWFHGTSYHITRIPCSDISSEAILSSVYHVAIIDFNQVNCYCIQFYSNSMYYSNFYFHCIT